MRHGLQLIAMMFCVWLSGCQESAAPEVSNSRTAGQTPLSTGLIQAAEAAPAPAAVKSASTSSLVLPAVTQAQIADALREGEIAFKNGLLYRVQGDAYGSLEYSLAVLNVQSDNKRAQELRQRSVDALYERVMIAARAGHVVDATELTRVIEQVYPGYADLPSLKSTLSQAEKADAVYQQGMALEKNKRIYQPKNNNAVARYQQAVKLWGEFSPPSIALRRLQDAELNRAWIAAEKGKYPDAESALQRAQVAMPGSETSLKISQDIFDLRAKRRDDAIQRATQLISVLQLDKAETVVREAEYIAGSAPSVIQLRKKIETAKLYGLHDARAVFRDTLSAGATGPELVAIPAGEFRMGALHESADEQELPVRNVRFARGFALSRNEITVADFALFIKSSKYKTDAEREGFSYVHDARTGRLLRRNRLAWWQDELGKKAASNMPVAHVSWQDANQYVQWLSQQSGQKYRLPSEAEFEYALRAGSAQRYAWGDAVPTSLVANLAGDGRRSEKDSDSGHFAGYVDGFSATAPVRSFREEPFATFDLRGNLHEWTADCWHDNYQRAPVDGSVWDNPGCERFVIRGPSWASGKEEARASWRSSAEKQSRNSRIGLRVVREI